jgi:hypothetical protein
MAQPNDKADALWLTAMAEYEGQPLALRVRRRADNTENRAEFPRLALVSHALAEVSSNGLPSPTYNDSLADFDGDIHTALERDGAGLVVLVETFAGKRNYYAYVAENGPVQRRLAELQQRYPQHTVSLRGAADPGWSLYADYRKRFPW